MYPLALSKPSGLGALFAGAYSRCVETLKPDLGVVLCLVSCWPLLDVSYR